MPQEKGWTTGQVISMLLEEDWKKVFLLEGFFVFVFLQGKSCQLIFGHLPLLASVCCSRLWK
jgi:hypothetical protein